VREHSLKATRRFHYVGTTAAMVLIGASVLTRKRWLAALVPVVGYGGAWIGHFFVEKNRPATFTYPSWSFQADFKMWSMMVRGVMDAEVERILSDAANDDAPAPGGNGSGRMEISNGNGAGRETLN
jgi:hypothetical protein